MKKLAPRISLVCWALLLARALSIFVLHPSAIFKLSAQAWFQTVVFVGAIGAGLALSTLLCRRPERMLALMLAALSLFLLWKQFVVVMLIQMDPRGGGLTLQEAFGKWWWYNTRTVLSSLTEVPFAGFMLVSTALWPCYAVLYGKKDDQNV